MSGLTGQKSYELGEAPASPSSVTDGAMRLLSQAGLLPALAQGELGGEAGSGPGGRAQKHFLWILKGLACHPPAW